MEPFGLVEGTLRGRRGCRWGATLLVLLGCAPLARAAAAPGTAATPPAAPSAPKLVLCVAVDQMRADYLVRFAPLFEGGFKTLLERGAVFPNAAYRHANTETGPGHALLLSGRHARDTGIVANAWYDRLARKLVNVVEDPSVRPVGGPGQGRSPAHFIGQTLGDRLKRQSPASRVVGVALKDRAAILMAGPRADAAYWYDPQAGGFITSSYYMSSAPAWLQAWNASGRVDALAGRSWERLLPDLRLYERYAGPDDVAGEYDRRETRFPHPLRGQAGSAEFYSELRRTPFADELTLELALAALDGHELGRDSSTDLLALGLSATDTVGHTYGPDSQELLDQLLRLDRLLARLLAEIEKRVGGDGYLLVLASDHGVMPLVEVLQARGLPARRVRAREIEEPVRAALTAAFPDKSGLIAAFDAPHFYLDFDALARQGLRRAEVEAVIERAALATGYVERVYTAARLLGDPPAGDAEFALFRNAFFEPRSPHVLLHLKPYLYVDDQYAGGTGHGSPHDYDRQVALAFLGRGIKSGRYAQPCGPEEVAPTLSALLGLEFSLEEGQRVLKEMLAP